MTTCICGHSPSDHRPSAPNPTPWHTEPVIVVRRGECQAQRTERGGSALVYCTCPRYMPEDGER